MKLIQSIKYRRMQRKIVECAKRAESLDTLARFLAPRSNPQDTRGTAIVLDDVVDWGGRVMQVVAMSHGGKVVLREMGCKHGGVWVPAHDVQVLYKAGSTTKLED